MEEDLRGQIMLIKIFNLSDSKDGRRLTFLLHWCQTNNGTMSAQWT